MSFSSEYRGSSFMGLLRANHDELMPRFNSSSVTIPTEFVHGTTITALQFRDGVLLGGDRRATMGVAIMNEEVTKVYKIDDYSVMAIAGAFGPSVKMARLFQVEIEHYEKIEGVELSADGKANKLSLMIEANLPMAMQGLVVMPLYVCFDPEAGKGNIYEYDITGGLFTKTQNEPYATSGSGGERARATIEHFWRDDLSQDEAVALLQKAIEFAAKRDGATGGKNYIVMAATANGVETVLGGEE